MAKGEGRRETKTQDSDVNRGSHIAGLQVAFQDYFLLQHYFNLEGNIKLTSLNLHQVHTQITIISKGNVLK